MPLPGLLEEPPLVYPENWRLPRLTAHDTYPVVLHTLRQSLSLKLPEPQPASTRNQ